jgi:hypothetical protein
MAAIDFIKGREFKKYKFHDATWDLVKPSGSADYQLIMNGELQSGSVDWNKSRYLKTGKNNEFWCFLSGTGVAAPHYKVFLDSQKTGYVPPKDFGWKLPVVSPDDEDDE